MKIKYVSKNYKPATRFKEVLEKKLDKLDRYFADDASVKVNLTHEGKLDKLELTINSKGAFFRSEVVSDNMYNNIDIALPKIERQVIKHGAKFASKLKATAFAEAEPLFLQEKPKKVVSKIAKTKRFELLPTTVEDAIAQMEALGHDFYIFLNVDNGLVSVVYRRNDNNHGVIEVIQ